MLVDFEHAYRDFERMYIVEYPYVSELLREGDAGGIDVIPEQSEL
jgi:hypothetical protein